MSEGLARNLAKLAAVRFFLWMHLFAAVIVPTAHPVASVALSVAAGGLGFARLPLFSADLNRHIPSERRATVLSAVRTLGVAALTPRGGG